MPGNTYIHTLSIYEYRKRILYVQQCLPIIFGREDGKSAEREPQGRRTSATTTPYHVNATLLTPLRPCATLPQPQLMPNTGSRRKLSQMYTVAYYIYFEV